MTLCIDTIICQQQHPVIVGVDLNAEGDPGHYVLVTGKSGGDYQIIDPFYVNRTVLSQYNNAYITRGFVADPPGDISELDVWIGDGAEFMLIDPSQRRTGFDGGSGELVEEIPNSVYFRDSLNNDVTGAPATKTSHVAEITLPEQGVYQIVVSGLKPGTFALSLRMFAQDGSFQPATTIAGIAGAGSTTYFSAQVSPVPGASPSIGRAATFASTTADIDNALLLGLIDNYGIANSLRQKLRAAQGATGKVRANILDAFKNEVNVQAGKHIKALAVQVLLQDADSLHAQKQRLESGDTIRNCRHRACGRPV